MNHHGKPAPAPQGIGKLPGQIVKERLRAMGKTQKWLAFQCGYTETTVNSYLNGRQQLLSNLSITRKFCRFLKLTLDDLYGTGPKKR